ncbi:allophanate hydrolase [Hyphomicrobium sp.]|uniref:allophanate hydrolase n=1 Tax=Hyphomicrobium sp. TaxID=82 RepID=UPI0025B8C38E|nr:allophanate hydrolase [Hyphomicrobium sp.]MCC7251538.1 allophanate hydrolase [Hyphomicrobium sp.]
MTAPLTSQSLDIDALKEGYAAGAFIPSTIVEEVYLRIADAGERPVWITLVPKEMALEKAKRAQGPLAGIPFAVKDNIDVAGLPTTCACPDFAYVPERSATVVERLEAAGAILIGKTNLDQFATGLVGTRSPYGIPASVFDPDYISGGSSSGSAVAVASGLVSFALGTDTAGSGRVPAAFNNIVGLKPTKGLVSARGVVPACRTQDTVSVFALTISDAAAVTSIAAAFDGEDVYARKAMRPFAVETPPAGLRVGVPADGLEFFGDGEAERLYRMSVERLAERGARIVEIDFAPFRDAARLLYQGPWVAERLAAIRTFAEQRPEALHEVVGAIIRGADKLSAVETFEGMYRLAELTRSAEAQWQTMDAMLLPTTGTTYRISDVLADPIQLNSNLGTYTNFVNLMDLSALAVPAGFRPNGLPFGVTLIGPAFDDGRLAAIGDALHRTLPDQRLGATTRRLDETPAATPSTPGGRVAVAVVGAHLTGQPLNSQLQERNARLVTTARTAPGYRFYALAGTTPAKPGLVFDGEGAGGIEVEIWDMDERGFGSFVALIPPPLGIGTLKLADGSLVKGFLCEPHAVRDATDITAFGGWRAWLAR